MTRKPSKPAVRPVRDWADKKAEQIVIHFWDDIEHHWYGRKAPIAKLEARIARELRAVERMGGKCGKS